MNLLKRHKPARTSVAILALLGLSACGASGEPAPAPDEETPAVHASAEPAPSSAQEAPAADTDSDTDSDTDTDTATDPATDSASPQPDADAGSDSAASEVAAVPGFAPGDFPAIPLFALPDIELLTGSADEFTLDVHEELADIPGATVTAASCDEEGSVISGTGTLLYSDGGASLSDSEQTVTNDGEGAGTVSDAEKTIVNNGDGSGSLSTAELTIITHGDGSGSYSDATLTVTVDGDGSGTYSDASVTNTNNGDGSGTYSDAAVTILNNGDGSGSYSDARFTITNDGEGTAVVNGVAIDAEPLPPVPHVGAFPSISALEPLESCGTLITFEDGVLFDFGKSDIRPDAAETLQDVAGALTEAQIEQATISGHTDSIGTDEFNQELSEARAGAVEQSLLAAGVTTSLTSTWFGESRPVALNEIDGDDNPAGRQLNRRVEIFVRS